MSQNTEKNEVVTKITNYGIYIVVGFGLFIVFVFVLTGEAPIDDEGDFSSWFAVLISSTIAVFVALSIMTYSNSVQTQIHTMVEEQKEEKKQRRSFAIKEIANNVIDADQFNQQLEDALTEYDKTHQKEEAIDAHERLKGVSSEFRLVINTFSYDLPHEVIEKINHLRHFLEGEIIWNTEFTASTSKANNDMIQETKLLLVKYDCDAVRLAEEERDQMIEELVTKSMELNEMKEKSRELKKRKEMMEKILEISDQVEQLKKEHAELYEK